MRLNPEQWLAHLRGELRPVYVVASEETLLLNEAMDAFRASARKQGYAEREVLHAERGFDWTSVAQSSANLSLFSSRRLIEVSLPGGAPGIDGSKALRELAQSPPPDTVVVLVCGKVDWKTQKAAWYSAIEKAGASLFIEPVTPARLPAWISARLRAAGLSASPEAVQMLAERTEGNLLAAQQDIQKLALLFPGGKLDMDAVRGAVADSAHFEAFDLIEKVLVGDARGVSRSLPRLREEGVELQPLLGAWSYALRTWASAATHFARTGDARSACQAAKLFGPRQDPYLRALPRATPAQVADWLARCSAIDLKGKSTGGAPAAWEDLLTCMLAASGVSAAASRP